MKFGLFNDDYGLIYVGTVDEINQYWSDFSDDYDEGALENSKMFLIDDPVGYDLDGGEIDIESDHERFVLLDGDDCQVFSGTKDEVVEYCREWWEENGEDWDFPFETVVPVTESVSFSVMENEIVID